MNPRRNISIPDELWNRAVQASLRISVTEGRPVSVSELIRRGLEKEIAKS